MPTPASQTCPRCKKSFKNIKSHLARKKPCSPSPPTAPEAPEVSTDFPQSPSPLAAPSGTTAGNPSGNPSGKSSGKSSGEPLMGAFDSSGFELVSGEPIESPSTEEGKTVEHQCGFCDELCGDKEGLNAHYEVCEVKKHAIPVTRQEVCEIRVAILTKQVSVLNEVVSSLSNKINSMAQEIKQYKRSGVGPNGNAANTVNNMEVNIYNYTAPSLGGINLTAEGIARNPGVITSIINTLYKPLDRTRLYLLDKSDLAALCYAPRGWDLGEEERKFLLKAIEDIETGDEHSGLLGDIADMVKDDGKSSGLAALLDGKIKENNHQITYNEMS